MSNKITLDDLLASQSSVLTRIARDIEEFNDHPSMAGHNSYTNGHNSNGTHTSHNSGVSAAPPLTSNDKTVKTDEV